MIDMQEMFNTINNQDIQPQQVETLVDELIKDKSEIKDDLLFALIEKSKMLDIEKKQKLYLHMMEYSPYIKDKELNGNLFDDDKIEQVVDFYFNKFPNSELANSMTLNKELNDFDAYHIFRLSNNDDMKYDICKDNDFIYTVNKKEVLEFKSLDDDVNISFSALEQLVELVDNKDDNKALFEVLDTYVDKDTNTNTNDNTNNTKHTHTR